MRARQTTFLAWGAVVAAFAAWTMMILFAFSIRSQQEARFADATESETAAARESTALRLHALVRDTKSAREQLDDLTRADFLSIADTIEGVGKVTGAKLKISGALPAPGDREQSGGTTLNETDFIVEAEGSFSALMHTAVLFENLPILSSMRSLEFQKTAVAGDGKKPAAWRLSARIRVLTAQNISS